MNYYEKRDKIIEFIDSLLDKREQVDFFKDVIQSKNMLVCADCGDEIEFTELICPTCKENAVEEVRAELEEINDATEVEKDKLKDKIDKLKDEIKELEATVRNLEKGSV